MKKLFTLKYLDTADNSYGHGVYIAEEREGLKKAEDMLKSFGISYSELSVMMHTYVSGYELIPFDISVQRALDSLKDKIPNGKSKEYLNGYRQALRSVHKLIRKQ